MNLEEAADKAYNKRPQDRTPEDWKSIGTLAGTLQHDGLLTRFLKRLSNMTNPKKCVLCGWGVSDVSLHMQLSHPKVFVHDMVLFNWPLPLKEKPK